MGRDQGVMADPGPEPQRAGMRYTNARLKRGAGGPETPQPHSLEFPAGSKMKNGNLPQALAWKTARMHGASPLPSPGVWVSSAFTPSPCIPGLTGTPVTLGADCSWKRPPSLLGH